MMMTCIFSKVTFLGDQSSGTGNHEEWERCEDWVVLLGKSFARCVGRVTQWRVDRVFQLVWVGGMYFCWYEEQAINADGFFRKTWRSGENRENIQSGINWNVRRQIPIRNTFIKNYPKFCSRLAITTFIVSIKNKISVFFRIFFSKLVPYNPDKKSEIWGRRGQSW